MNEEKPYYINVAHMLKDYPETIQEKADRVLINLCRKYHNYDDLICLFGNEYRLLFEHEYNNQGNPGIIRLMCEMGLMSDRGSCFFAISANGWQRIYDLQAHKKEKKQGFIAMAFREETKPIREAIQNGIGNAGYSPLVIDEKEHNNQIVPEIFYEIVYFFKIMLGADSSKVHGSSSAIEAKYSNMLEKPCSPPQNA